MRYLGVLEHVSVEYNVRVKVSVAVCFSMCIEVVVKVGMYGCMHVEMQANLE